MTANTKEYYILPSERHVYVSAKVWHEVYPKVDTAPFIYQLYESIDFPSYGDGLRKFYLTFIVTQPHNKKHQPGRYYSRKKRELEVAVRLPYEAVYQATEAETFRMLEAAFLEGIDHIGKVKLDAPFDHLAFKRDVAAIFEKADWYVDAVPEDG